MSSLLFGGPNLLISLLRQLFYLGRFWRIGWIHPFLSNHPGTTLPILQIVQWKTAIAAEIESIISPKQKRRPLPFLLSSSFFYGCSRWQRITKNMFCCRQERFADLYGSENTSKLIPSKTQVYSRTIWCRSFNFLLFCWSESELKKLNHTIFLFLFLI